MCVLKTLREVKNIPSHSRNSITEKPTWVTLSMVDPYVILQRALLIGAIWTVTACIRLLPSVSPNVSFQVFRLRCSKWAIWTGIGLLSRVSPFMFFHICVNTCCVCTETTLHHLARCRMAVWSSWRCSPPVCEMVSVHSHL